MHVACVYNHNVMIQSTLMPSDYYYQIHDDLFIACIAIHGGLKGQNSS